MPEAPGFGVYGSMLGIGIGIGRVLDWIGLDWIGVGLGFELGLDWIGFDTEM